MPQDRVLNWREESRPSEDDVRVILEDFFAGAGTVEWKQDRFYCYLPGKWSWPLRRVANMPQRPEPDPGFVERYMEVWFDDNCLFVMTREMDEYTNGLAERLTDVFVRAYQAKRMPL